MGARPRMIFWGLKTTQCVLLHVATPGEWLRMLVRYCTADVLKRHERVNAFYLVAFCCYYYFFNLGKYKSCQKLITKNEMEWPSIRTVNRDKAVVQQNWLKWCNKTEMCWNRKLPSRSLPEWLVILQLRSTRDCRADSCIGPTDSAAIIIIIKQDLL